jgi:hypothetical protein
MKNFREILSDERSTATLVTRRDNRNAEHKLTKAQREVQEMSAAYLDYWLEQWATCDRLVARGLMHPLQHPYRSIIDEIELAQKLKPHPSSVVHPLAAAAL